MNFYFIDSLFVKNIAKCVCRKGFVAQYLFPDSSFSYDLFPDYSFSTLINFHFPAEIQNSVQNTVFHYEQLHSNFNRCAIIIPAVKSLEQITKIGDRHRSILRQLTVQILQSLFRHFRIVPRSHRNIQDGFAKRSRKCSKLAKKDQNRPSKTQNDLKDMF